VAITSIEWTFTVHPDGTVTPGYTFNPWMGCQHVSPGCDHCYAEADRDKRFHQVQWGPHGQRKRTSVGYWKGPLKWAKDASANSGRPRVFCASLADVWDNRAPAEWRRDLFRLIQQTPELDWMLLTKRPENITKMLRAAIDGLDEPWPWPNVWLGATAEDQEHYDRRWPILRGIPAVVHFISYEPAIGPLRLHDEAEQPDWLICGGESGGGARYMEPQWAAHIKADCAARGVAFFLKQVTGKELIPPSLMLREFPQGEAWRA
jgi:protein gp37